MKADRIVLNHSDVLFYLTPTGPPFLCNMTRGGHVICATGEKEMAGGDFYVRYYVGHKGKFGHEFLEFEFRPDGEREEIRAELWEDFGVAF